MTLYESIVFWSALITGAILGIMLLVMFILIVLRPILFKIAVRNAQRRILQSILLILGLTISTAVITVSLSIGDTVYSSARQSVFDELGHTDFQITVTQTTFTVGEEPVYPAFSSDEAAMIEGLVGTNSDVDGVLPVVFIDQRALNSTAVLLDNERVYRAASDIEIFAYDTERLDAFGDLRDSDGDLIDTAGLTGNEVVLSANLGSILTAEQGDTLQLIIDGMRTEVTVIAIAELGGIAGSSLRVLMDIDNIYGILPQIPDGAVNRYEISAVGGINPDADVLTRLSDVLEEFGVPETENGFISQPTVIDVENVKQNGLQVADFVGALSSLLFTFFGSFSIAAGIFLIILIFILLAASRQQEIGIARAVGMQAGEVVRLYIYEGLVYAIPAAVLGVGLGVLSAFILTEVVLGPIQGALPSESQFIRFSVNINSLLLGFFTGMLLTFVTMIIASFFTSRLNIVVAIRGLVPELIDKKESIRRDLLVILGGPVLGIYRAVKSPASIGIAIISALYLLVTIALVVNGGLAYFSDNFNAGEILQLVGGVVLWNLYSFREVARTGVALIIGGGITFIILRFNTEQVPYDWTIVSAALIVAGIGLFLNRLIRTYLARNRWWISDWIGALASASIIYFMLGSEGQLAWLVSDDPVLPPGTVFFILGSLFLVASGVLILTFLSRYVAFIISETFGRIPGFSLTFRLAVAHAFASRVRTGLNVMTFSLVIFSMIVFAAFNESTQVPEADVETVTGGVDIFLEVGRPVPDGLEESIRQSDRLDIADFESITARQDLFVDVSFGGITSEASLSSFGSEWFMNNSLSIANMNTEYGETSQEIWQAVGQNSNLVVINFATLFSAGGGGPFGEVPDDEQSPEFMIDPSEFEFGWPTVTLSVEGIDGVNSEMVEIVGIVGSLADTSRSSTVYANEALSEQLTDTSDAGAFVFDYNIRLNEGVNINDTVATLEAEFVDYGANGINLVGEVEIQNSNGSAFSNLFLGFMSIGLIAGTIGLGVVAFRSVVERRRTIGVSRAIGFSSISVGAQFMIESLLIALLSVGVGVGLGVALTARIFADIASGPVGSGDLAYSVPWTMIIVVTTVVVLASVLITIGVAIQASRIKPAETLRTE